MSTDTAQLRIRAMARSFGGITAVDGVDLDVGQGEIVGLVGPNGAGKTTLVDLIGGQQPASGGSVELGGRKLPSGSAARARSGIVRTYQQPRLALDITARENIIVGAAARYMGSTPRMAWQFLRGMVRPGTDELDRMAVRLAERLMLPEIDRPCSALTLGQMRLCEVARALAQQPRVLLCDEPFSGVDERGSQRISEAIHEVTQDGCSVILIDHNIDLVAGMVDRMVLMDHGRVSFDGDPRDCVKSPEMEEAYFGVRQD